MALPNWQRTITDSEGNVVPSAQITVLVEATGLAANLFEDREGNTPLSNPFNTGSDGFAEFHVASGVYRVIAESAIGTRTWRYEWIMESGTDPEQVPTNDNLQSGYDFQTMPNVSGSPVVESGSNSDGEWTRWADGTQIVTAIVEDEIAVDTEAGSIWRTSVNPSYPFPEDFMETYAVSGNRVGGESGSLRSNSWGPFFNHGSAEASLATTEWDSVAYFSGSETSEDTMRLCLFAIGRWK